MSIELPSAFFILRPVASGLLMLGIGPSTQVPRSNNQALLQLNSTAWILRFYDSNCPFQDASHYSSVRCRFDNRNSPLITAIGQIIEKAAVREEALPVQGQPATVVRVHGGGLGDRVNRRATRACRQAANIKMERSMISRRTPALGFSLDAWTVCSSSAQYKVASELNLGWIPKILGLGCFDQPLNLAATQFFPGFVQCEWQHGSIVAWRQWPCHKSCAQRDVPF